MPLTIICFNLKRKNKLFFLFILLIVPYLTANNKYSFAVGLEYDNGYLSKNVKSDILAYIMIHFTDLKLEVSTLDVRDNSIKELSYLVSKYHNISVYSARLITFEYVNISKNPVSLFHMYTKPSIEKTSSFVVSPL